ncbi:MAG: hypothetical protein H0U74_08645 [Bradymonadaceae bacterium]|nr:hypothetical protein [Lujinxingiaceae bacterium]
MASIKAFWQALCYGKSDRTRNWKRDESVALRYELETGALSGVRLQEPADKISFLGPVDRGDVLCKSGTFDYQKSLGLVLHTNNDDLLYEMELYANFPGELGCKGESLKVSPTTSAEQVEALLGEPDDRQRLPGGELHLSYERGAFVSTFEFTHDGLFTMLALTDYGTLNGADSDASAKWRRDSSVELAFDFSTNALSGIGLGEPYARLAFLGSPESDEVMMGNLEYPSMGLSITLNKELTLGEFYIANSFAGALSFADQSFVLTEQTTPDELTARFGEPYFASLDDEGHEYVVFYEFGGNLEWWFAFDGQERRFLQGCVTTRPLLADEDTRANYRIDKAWPPGGGRLDAQVSMPIPQD